MQYNTKKLEERFNKLPDDIKAAISSTDTGNIIQKIGNKYDLTIDQISDLNEEVGFVMLGVTSSNIFVKVISKKLEISREKALLIATDVNTEIFDSIRDSLKKIQAEEENKVNTMPTPLPNTTPTVPPKEQIISSLQKVGNISIEERPTSSSPQYKDTNLNREATLKGIEDAPIPFVDHLLSNPVSNANKVEIKNNEIEKDNTKLDPYRERIQ